MSEGRGARVHDAATIALAAAALSQLPALGTLVVQQLGSEPAVRAAGLAAALGVGVLALRRSSAGRAWLWLAPVALVVFGRVLALLAAGCASLAGEETQAALGLPLRAGAALVAGAGLGALLGLGGAALARSRRAGLFFASLAATFALVPDAPSEIGAGMGAVALGAWFARREYLPPRRQDAKGAWAVLGLAAVIGVSPIAGRLVSLSGSAPSLVALVTVLGLVLGARIGRVPVAALAAPLLAGAVVVASPPLGVLLALVGLAAVAAGTALRAQPVALAVAALLGAGVEQGLLHAAERSWTSEKKMTLARATGDVLQSFALSSHGAVAVVDSRPGNVRELRRDGVLLGAVAIGKGPSEADVATPVLASVLAQLLGRSGGRIACLGLGDGIAAETLGRTSGLTDLFLVEPDPAIRALRDDPGDLFHGAWKVPFSWIVAEDPSSFLRRSRRPFDAVVDLEDLLADPSGVALRIAKNRLVAGGALVRIVRDGPRFHEEAAEFARIFGRGTLAFRAPLARGAAILVGGVASIDTQRPLASGILRQLEVLRLPQGHLLGAYAAGAEGIRRARSVAELSPVGGDAALLAGALGGNDALIAVADSCWKLGETSNALLLVRAARDLGAQPAYEIDRVEGDARFSVREDAAAVACWRRALDAAPSALSPRLSLATRHYKRREFDAARKLLDGRNEPAARYLLGLVSFAKYEFKDAREHFEAARGYEDAEKREALSRQLEEQATEMKPKEGPRPLKPEEKDPKRLLRDARALLEDAAKKEAEQVAYCRERGLTVSAEHRAQFLQQRVDAVYLLEIAARKEPDDAAIRFELGRAKRAVGDLRGAIEHFEAAARLDAKDARPLYAIGDALRELGEREAALDAYERGLARGPISSSTARVYLACSDLLVELKRYADAARKLEEAERLSSLDVVHPSIPVNLGSLYERLGRNADAVRAYRRWLDLVGPEGGDPEVRKRVLAAIERLERGR